MPKFGEQLNINFGNEARRNVINSIDTGSSGNKKPVMNEEKIDLKKLTDSELEELKENDPGLFYRLLEKQAAKEFNKYVRNPQGSQTGFKKDEKTEEVLFNHEN